jgi:hypothetical protein
MTGETVEVDQVVLLSLVHCRAFVRERALAGDAEAANLDAFVDLIEATRSGEAVGRDGMKLVPARTCRVLGHEIAWELVASGSGDRVEVCLPCTKVYDAALLVFNGDKRIASKQVRKFRTKTEGENEQ